MTELYVLRKNNVPRRVKSETAWAQWMYRRCRLNPVAKSKGIVSLCGVPLGNVEVSTVFLGINHRFGEGPPLLFETMVFGGPMDQYCLRCSTYDEALIQHDLVIERVRLAYKDTPHLERLRRN